MNNNKRPIDIKCSICHKDPCDIEIKFNDIKEELHKSFTTLFESNNKKSEWGLDELIVTLGLSDKFDHESLYKPKFSTPLVALIEKNTSEVKFYALRKLLKEE